MTSNSDAPSVESPLEDPSARSTSDEGDSPARQAAVLSRKGANTNTLQKNPFAELTYEDVMEKAQAMAEQHQLPEEDVGIFKKGAALAKAQEDDLAFEDVPAIMAQLTDEEKKALDFERNSPWKSLPKMAYFTNAVCAGCAVVQGADQTIINGAQSFYFVDFDIGPEKPLLRGFINGAPYIAAALLGCWLNTPLNNWLGRRAVLFISCVIAVITAITQAVSPNWHGFIASRFVLGLAVGAKSATTPMYAAECAPKKIRGALVMQWQMFTAFGIMIGYIISLIFQDAPTFGPNSQWRWMLGATALPPAIVMVFIFLCPESPRWYIEKEKMNKSYKAFCRLRCHKILAARDCYSACQHQEAQARVLTKGWGKMFAEFKKRRNLRAAQGAYFVMIMQQFCGVNVLAYYSTTIFRESGFSQKAALLVSLGCGILNFLGALPALFTIDRFGRRRLLLTTLPVLGLLLYITSAAYSIKSENVRLAFVATTLYLFMFAYSPGMGPVPFTYSAEVFSLSARPLGMSSATSITWMFNFVISFTFPKMMESMGKDGAFSFYATCNIVGWVYTYFFLPETKEASLEHLDAVFAGTNRHHAAVKWANLKRWWKKTILRQDVTPQSDLVDPEEVAKPEDNTGRRSLVRNHETAEEVEMVVQRRDDV